MSVAGTALMDAAEPPECPVCLQPYDAVSTVPRVLPCGHTTCEACLKQLPNPFPQAIRCPSCTILVKFPNGPSSLPKNLDLLHITAKPKTVISRTARREDPSLPPEFIPKPWPYEFYSKWKRWVLKKDCVLLENVSTDHDGEKLRGKIAKYSDDDDDHCVMGLVLRKNKNVGFVKIGVFKDENEGSRVFEYAYEWKIMQVLHGLKESKRNKLNSIISASWRVPGIGKVYGFWYNENDQRVYMVSEKLNSHGLLKSLSNEEKRLNSAGKISGFVMVALEMCEVLSRLHLEGLVIGCLDVNSFGFDEFGRVYFGFSEILHMGRKLSMIMRREEQDLKVRMKAEFLENYVFISPEVLSELFRKEGIELGCGKWTYKVGLMSDVWSVACLLIWLVVGTSFVEEMENYLHFMFNAVIDEKERDYLIWVGKIVALLETKLDPGFVSIKDILCKCLDLDPGIRPTITELWKSLRELITTEVDEEINLAKVNEDTDHCIILGELSQVVKETGKEVCNPLEEEEEETGKSDLDDEEGLCGYREVVEGLSRGHVRCIDLKGHLDCITGLAVGGDFIFGSSFDKMVHVWSLQDFKHVHSFKGHEHRVMAVVFVHGEYPLCISGDNGGAICIWKANMPLGESPIKKLHEQKDWRYSGIHAMAVSGTEYLYTGGGDKLVKAWSLQDYTLSSTMTGHKSVVSSLVVSNGVLYSGSWDGTVRLWCLSDHSPLTVLGEGITANMTSVLSLSADNHMLIASHENGCVRIWNNDMLVRSTQVHAGAVFSVNKKGKWLFTGGWDKIINVQEILECGDQTDVITVGSIACDCVITALLHWQGKLFVGQADKIIKVYYHGA